MHYDFDIIVDSTTDISQQLADDLNLIVIPYIYNLDDHNYHNYLDYREMSVKDFYDKLREGKKSTTSQVTAFRYKEAWTPSLEAGRDVLYMCLSSGLSKSFEQSQLAARECLEQYPDRKVVTIDTLSASVGQGILAYYAAKARAEGQSFDAVVALMHSMVPKVMHWIMANDLHHLRRGGRVSGAAAFVGTMLNVKPILTLVDDGKIVPVHKARGVKKAFEYFVDKMNNVDLKGQVVGIAHSDSAPAAEELKNLIAAAYNVDNFIVSNIGPVIGTHTGPGTVAVVFLGQERIKQ